MYCGRTPEFDQDLFLATWGPTVAALSSVFDHSEEKRVVQRAIGGFSKCASVAARYELRDIFDNVIISLCKFSTLLSTPESPGSVFLSLGQSPKIRDIFHLVFSLAHRHGDILREDWKNILDCLLTLFKAKLFPDCLMEAKDFLHPEGRVSLFREEVPAKPSDSSLLSYWLLSDSQSATGKNLTPSEIKARKIALKCVKECHPEQLFSESKFLQVEGLREFLKALVFTLRGPEAHLTLGTVFDEDSAIFFLELLVSVALENKDRIGLFRGELSNHLSRIILTAHRHRHLMERAVVGLLRLAIRLMSREGMATQLLSSLRVLLTLPPPTLAHLRDIHKQMANGITELVHSHAGTIKSPLEWSILFTVLDYCGSGLSQYGHRTTPGHVAMETMPNTMQSHDQEVGVAMT